MRKNRQKKKRNFFYKFYLLVAGWILLSFLLLGIVMLFLITIHWWNETFDTLKINSERISEDYVDALYGDNSDSALRKLILGNDINTISFATEADYFICDAQGKVIVCQEFLKNNGSVCEKHENIDIKSGLVERAREEGGFVSFTSLDDDIRDTFVVGIPIKHDGAVIGEVFAVSDAVTGLLPYAASMLKIIMISIFIALILSYVAVYLYSRKMTRPIADMIEATDRYAKGDFSYRINLDGIDGQMSEMAKALNLMFDELSVDNEAKKSFVANVSHELKTPMTTIGGFVDGILDGTIPPDKEKEYLQTVSTEVKRLSRLVVAMLNLSKIESGEVSLKPKRYNISSQIIETLLSMEQRIVEKNISIEGVDTVDGVMIYGDRDLLHQVMYNLLDNAIKFTPENGYIKFFAKENSGSVTITVRNSGQGLSSEQKARVFERFYKVDQSRSFDIKGVGLGLYIVKTIVNMHDGTIIVDSKEGEYTEFSFNLPVIKE